MNDCFNMKSSIIIIRMQKYFLRLYFCLPVHDSFVESSVERHIVFLKYFKTVMK